MKKRKVNYIISVLFLFSLISCATTSSFEGSVYKNISTTANSYETTMQYISDEYAKGNIDKAGKDEVIKVADVYWKNYHDTVVAFENYKKNPTEENKLNLKVSIAEMDRSFLVFTTTVAKVLKKNKE